MMPTLAGMPVAINNDMRPAPEDLECGGDVSTRGATRFNGAQNPLITRRTVCGENVEFGLTQSANFHWWSPA